MKRKVFKWIGIGFAGLLGLLLVALMILFFLGQAQVNKTYAIAVESISIPRS